MSAQLINGKEVSQKRLQAVAEAVAQRQQNNLHKPCLAVVFVGGDPASAVYVRNKKTACQKCGIKSLSYELHESTSQEELLALVDRLNADSEVDGILVQLPLRSTSTARRFWNIFRRIRTWTASIHTMWAG